MGWPTRIETWIEEHPEHILYKAAQLRYRESLEALKKDHLSANEAEWKHALMAIRCMMQFYHRLLSVHDFEVAAEMVFSLMVRRRLDGPENVPLLSSQHVRNMLSHANRYSSDT